jgi:hypothetical protein
MMKQSVHKGDVYLIPVHGDQQAVVTILSVGFLSWNPLLAIMLVGVHDRLVQRQAESAMSAPFISQYWCVCSFVEQGHWSRVRHGTRSNSELVSADGSIWATHELFLDELRKRLGLERQTYTSAECTFSTHCVACRSRLPTGFARCPNCRAIREEFVGLERYVTDEFGHCCLSGAMSDVKDSDGNYYWAPYFIDRVRAGEVPGSDDT